jgi:hypothetical protein
VEGVGHVAGPVPSAGDVDPGLEPLQQCGFRSEELRGRRAQVGGAAQRRMVTAVAAGYLKCRIAKLCRVGLYL